jgi:hypothetical protein
MSNRCIGILRYGLEGPGQRTRLAYEPGVRRAPHITRFRSGVVEDSMKTRIATKTQSSAVRVRLQLDPAKLCQLIAAGHLCATDFVCLDCGSRDVLKRIFLQCSTR